MKRLAQLWYWVYGLYLRFSGGEIPRWLPVLGEHHLFDGIRFEFGEVHFTDAATRKKRSVALVDSFGYVEMLTDSGKVVKLISSGTRSAVLIHPDGVTTERLRCNKYSTEIRRHGLVNFFVHGLLGGAHVVVLTGGKIRVGNSQYSLTATIPWKHKLPDGSLLEYRSQCKLVHRFGSSHQAYLWAAKDDRLLRVDYHRKELRFAWVTNESLSSTTILDGLVTVHPEDGTVQLMHHSVYARGEPIEFYGPRGLRIVREEGSDVLWAWQGEILIGVAEFVVNGGIDKNCSSYHRWRFSAGGYAALPQGEPWLSPLTTAAVAAVPVVVALALLVSETLALAVATPVILVVGAVAVFRSYWPVVRHILS